MKILNLGCGTKTSSSPEIVNIDRSLFLRLKKSAVPRVIVELLLRGERMERFASIPDNILVHDLSKGIPFQSNSVDAVYHSHLLEHLDLNTAKEFLSEVRRVLKPGGIHRIVVPDLEKACTNYLSHIRVCNEEPKEAVNHDDYIGAIIEQSVRREAHGTSQQPPLRRCVENLLLGSARRRGETHQWMYDRFNLGELLARVGYRDSQALAHSTSQIPNWKEYGLDVDENDDQYKPGSLYMEARK